MFQRRLSQPIVAVEGNPQNVPLLRRNLPDVVVIDRPVAATRRKVKMTTGRLDGCRILDDDNGVETITMDDIDGSIGLLKIDVEGIEEELLADCPRWIHRVAAIVCECHYPYTGDDMLAALRDGGANPQIVARLDAPIFNYDLVTVRLGDPDEV
jgi:FkbM family methyltransferase